MALDNKIGKIKINKKKTEANVRLTQFFIAFQNVHDILYIYLYLFGYVY